MWLLMKTTRRQISKPKTLAKKFLDELDQQHAFQGESVRGMLFFKNTQSLSTHRTRWESFEDNRRGIG